MDSSISSGPIIVIAIIFGLLLLGGAAFFIFSLVKAIKTGATRWIISCIAMPFIGIVGIAMAAGLSAPMIIRAKNASDAKELRELAGRLVSADGRVSLRVPKSWKEIEHLNDHALIEGGNKFGEKYVIVIEDQKDTLGEDDTFESLSESTSQQITNNLKNGAKEPAEDVMIGSWPAKRYRITGKIKGDGMLKNVPMSFVYYHTCLMTDTGFYQILQWTFEKNERDFKKTCEAIEASLEISVEKTAER